MIFASENPKSVNSSPTPVAAARRRRVMKESLHVRRIWLIGFSFRLCCFILAEESGII